MDGRATGLVLQAGANAGGELRVGALGKNGVAPGEVLYVGNDMLNDVYAAGQVGFRTALFAGDQRSLRMRQR